ncbi:GNAT family N-acetyltransferase [Pedobacter heparinus]|uniref:GCN5-related N-acetyltransferase n=1 Tax=Pedobacter heparinus (strain ATCC 13125 / DSM 2366 / CIP 104194 / JCM 7457 / NBRC 12017 / NCIMB 9290 / NRRL B-14731 / HIM 762-3) TaxID=485917 RepID=C6XVQ3_PEDHD|nr:GNAT family N-acetyltransferase [Pedobacter heparinus]ACU06128.1 GCN5-related N-acetyltransferase [Pedobacter heparinus DSM 2366]
MEINKNIFIRGNHIDLRLLTKEDISGNYSNWLNDPEITHYNSHGRFPATNEDLVNYVEQSRISRNALVLAVVDQATQAHIGNVSLQSINWIDRNAEIAFLLGEKAYWGKGIMLEAGEMLINHGFKMLNLHRIYCGTSSENVGMQRLALKLGMIEEGLRKDALYKQGKYVDVIEYGILSKKI